MKIVSNPLEIFGNLEFRIESIKPVLEELGIWYSVNSKNNLGMGEPAFDFYGKGGKS